mmetsp:Transcript_1296/g.1608  ORF Transcript_1296/g.1608 Transcript_1296/m.1608 type:complete len:132 (+) Transcript_1296:961-1356(+)
MSNTLIVRPLINLFCGEFKGGDFRKQINELAAQKKNIGKVGKVVREAIELFRKKNNESLENTGGERIVRPSWASGGPVKVKEDPLKKSNEKQVDQEKPKDAEKAPLTTDEVKPSGEQKGDSTKELEREAMK